MQQRLEPDRDQLEIFVDAMFRYADKSGIVSLRSFYEDDSGAPFRINPTSLAGGLKFLVDVAEDDARRAANDPKSVVFCPPIATFLTKERARERDIAEGFALSVECDHHPQEAREALERLIGRATVVVRSGGIWTDPATNKQHDKIHLHWRLSTPARGENLAKLKHLRDLAARIVGGDPSNKPVCHPIRWPGSWHRKGEPRPCVITEALPDNEVNLDTGMTILELLTRSAKKHSNEVGETTDPGTSSEWGKLINDIITGASFHPALAPLAMKLLVAGMTEGAAVNMLRGLMEASTAAHDFRWRTRFGQIPHDVSTAARKLNDEALEADAQKPASTLHWWHERGATPVERSWLIEGLLLKETTALASGVWGSYKSFTALDLAAAVMAAGSFVGFPVRRQGGCLYLAIEGASEIPIRLAAVLEDKYPTLKQVPFAWTDDCPRLLDAGAVGKLVTLAREADARMKADFGLPLVLIIVDTVVAAARYNKSGDENDAATNQAMMARLATLARATDAAVIGVDHFGKASETGTRGSSAKEGAADVVFALLADRSVGGEITNTRLAIRKNRAGPSGQEFPFRPRVVDMGTDQGGTALTTLVIDWVAQPDQSNTAAATKPKDGSGWSKSLKLLQRALMAVLVESGTEQKPFPDGPTVRAVDVEIVRGEFYKSYLAEGDTPQAKQAARRQAFHRAFKEAQNRDLVGVRQTGDTTLVWLTHSPRQEPPA
jgi:hypothetical protein